MKDDDSQLRAHWSGNVIRHSSSQFHQSRCLILILILIQDFPFHNGMELKSKMTMNSRIRLLFRHEHQELLVPVLCMFVGYVCHDALQERMFRFPGFEYGWFMTLVEVSTMLIGGLLLNDEFVRPTKSAILASALTGLCISTSHGCGNTALLYSTYPLKVAFKSCKLIPTMWLGVFITKRSFPWSQYLAAMIMCVGLVVLTLADWKPRSLIVDEPKFLFWIGPLLLAISTTLDSIVPNLQERLFSTAQCSTSQAMFLCNSFIFLISLSYTLVIGELRLALHYCYLHPHTLLVLLAQALAAYLGLQGYMTVVSRLGGVAAVLLANVRKLVTIVISFILFANRVRNNTLWDSSAWSVESISELWQKNGNEKKP